MSAPSSVWVSTASPPLPSPVPLRTWKLPAASVKPIGDAFRWSCHLLTKKKTWAAFWARFLRQEYGCSGSHEQGEGLLQNETSRRWNGTRGRSHRAR